MSFRGNQRLNIQMPKKFAQVGYNLHRYFDCTIFLTTGKYWVLSVRHECRAISECSGGLERG